MKSLGLVGLAVFVGLAACGGRAAQPTPPGATVGGAAGSAAQPGEAGSETAGAAGSDAAGAAGSNAAGAPSNACPVAKPETGADCGVGALACDYGGFVCSCGSVGWECRGGRIDCPAERPERGEGCSPNGACAYAEHGVCVCQARGGDESGDSVWGCNDEGPCPARKPTELASCDRSPVSWCGYEKSDCFCLGGHWRCAEQDPACPSAPPTGDCFTADQVCSYAGGVVCNCSAASALWMCLNR